MTVELRVDMSSLKRIVYAIAGEENSGQLKRDLARNLRKAAEPAVADSKRAILSMRSSTPHQGESLRSSIAQKVRASTRFSGDAAGVKVSAAWGGPRGFRTSARRTNRAAGWRHPLFGRWESSGRHKRLKDGSRVLISPPRTVAVVQHGKPEWFEGPLREHREQYQQAILEAMEDMAERIARRV